MTENEARAWVAVRWPVDAIDRLDRLVAAIKAESGRQNLIAASTVDVIWRRHIVDSLQLIDHAGTGAWLDIGTGAGFPGLAIAAVEPDREMTLVEPRRLRADFLLRCVHVLGLGKVVVEVAKAQAVSPRIVAIVSARAVAEIAVLLDAARHCTDSSTIWLLPKGRAAAMELAKARQTWHGVFHVEHSITDPDARIVVATDVRRRR